MLNYIGKFLRKWRGSRNLLAKMRKFSTGYPHSYFSLIFQYFFGFLYKKTKHLSSFLKYFYMKNIDYSKILSRFTS
jgi:hypothetical protein